MNWYPLTTNDGQEITLYQCYTCLTLSLDPNGYCEVCSLKDAIAELRRELTEKVRQNTNNIRDMEWRVAKIGKTGY